MSTLFLKYYTNHLFYNSILVKSTVVILSSSLGPSGPSFVGYCLLHVANYLYCGWIYRGDSVQCNLSSKMRQCSDFLCAFISYFSVVVLNSNEKSNLWMSPFWFNIHKSQESISGGVYPWTATASTVFEAKKKKKLSDQNINH